MGSIAHVGLDVHRKQTRVALLPESGGRGVRTAQHRVRPVRRPTTFSHTQEGDDPAAHPGGVGGMVPHG